MKRKLARVGADDIQLRGAPPWLWGLSLALCLSATVGCGPLEPEAELEESSLVSQEQAKKAPNGLSVNGLSVNGLSVNGLSVNGLASVAFMEWFNLNPQGHAQVMHYVVQCALAEGASLTYVNPVTGVTHTWAGLLNLAPDWGKGQAPSLREQQVVSACLAAHVNKFGRSVPISVLGKSAKGVPVPFTESELTVFSEKEACFFGNFFTSTGGLAASDRPLLSSKESSSRACGLSSERKPASCPSVRYVGSCSDFCTLDATGMYYAQCTYQGESFTPVTTRINPQEIFKCGDGVCQFTESCGTGLTPDSCLADCGKCP